MWTNQNPFLNGPFEPLFNEIVVHDLHVEGEIPRELSGALYRTGSNQHFQPANPERFHWFDGDGMVHAFRLKDGKASYCNRMVETDGLKAERAAGHALYNGIYGYAGVPQQPLPEGAPAIKSVAGINVIALAGRVLTMHEVDSYYWEIDRYTLETKGKFDFDQQFTSMITAHSHVDPKTGDTLFYALDQEQGVIECFALDTQGKLVSRHRTGMPYSPFIHDFIFSENYYIFVFGPIRFDPYGTERIARGLSSLSLDQNSPGHVLLMHRKTGAAHWLETEVFTAGHYLNAYEEDGRIIVDATITRSLHRSPDINVSDFFPFALVEAPSPFSGPELHRITIDPARNKVSHERVGDFAAEFVRPNETLLGTRHRYGYMAGIHAPRLNGRGFNCIIKHDYQENRSCFQHVSKHHDMIPGEPVFVPRAGAVAEDDGWVMAVWWDPIRNASEMVILAANDLDGEPVARILLDHHVPLGFHGNWIAD